MGLSYNITATNNAQTFKKMTFYYGGLFPVPVGSQRGIAIQNSNTVQGYTVTTVL